MVVVEQEGSLCGHGALSLCGLQNSEEQVELIGPLAVAPRAQGMGIGCALVHDLMAQGRDGFVPDTVLVLGDPGYYRRFGFRPDRSIAAPSGIEAAAAYPGGVPPKAGFRPGDVPVRWRAAGSRLSATLPIIRI